MRNPEPRAVELLAPAGEKASAYAAFAFGADAIYTGLKKFSARAEAVNLDPEELEEVTAYAHAQTPRKKVFVTVNTLVRTQEFPGVCEILACAARAGVDAIIVQDAGVARLARAHFPELALHASTQMAIHSLEGARAAQRMGFQRVTLARELGTEEIAEIAAQSGLEVEVFVHGALCYCYSGLCLYSALLRDRSGNRGQCAYPCRDLFEAQAGAHKGFAFSMKDLSAADFIPALQAAGVTSFKIEGRKKSPLYVAAAVHYYRRLLAGPLPAEEKARLESDLRSIFSRPWTSLYLRHTGKRAVIDPTFVGHRGSLIGKVEAIAHGHLRFTPQRRLEVHDGLQLDLAGADKPYGFAVESLQVLHQGFLKKQFVAEAGQPVEIPLPDDHPPIPIGAALYCSSSQEVKRHYRFDMPNPRLFRKRYSLEVALTLHARGLVAEGTVHIGPRVFKAQARMDAPLSPARDAAKTGAAAQEAFAKLGESSFVLWHLALANPDGLFAPLSLLNDLRRQLCVNMDFELEEFWRERIAAALPAPEPDSAPPPPGARPLWLIRTDQPDLLLQWPADALARVGEVLLDVDALPLAAWQAALAGLLRRLPQDRIRLALPLITRAWDRDELRQKIDALWSAGWRKWEAANWSAVAWLAGRDGLDLSADWPLYAMNPSAVEELMALGFTRLTCNPEDTRDNLRALAARYPGRLVWIGLQDVPLFVSESCPHAALLGHCPAPRDCKFSQMPVRSRTGEELLIVNRRCRFYTVRREPLNQLQDAAAMQALGLQQIRLDFNFRTHVPEAALRVFQQTV